MADCPTVPALDHWKKSGVKGGGSRRHVGFDHSINKHFKERRLLFMFGRVILGLFKVKEEGEGDKFLAEGVG